MFEKDLQARPRVLGLPPGADTPRSLAAKIADWRRTASPFEVAQARIFTNTRRLARSVTAALSTGDVALMPRIDVLTDAVAIAPAADLPPPVSQSEIALHLFPAVAAILKAEPGMAPRSAALDLSQSLAALAEEIIGEGIEFSELGTIPTEDATAYWSQSASFLSVVRDYLATVAQGGPEARRRLAVAARIAAWDRTAPDAPVLVLGSTGSRRTTADFMRAVARLPQGAVVLPGFDFDLPPDIFDGLPDGPEDHPQYRNAVFLRSLGLGHADVAPWDETTPKGARSLISLALRPAPVTAGWRQDAPALGDLMSASEGITLLEAPNARLEAASIALAVRLAVERGESVAVVTPDRLLGRRVDAALRRWKIRADISSGDPLGLTPRGRFLRLAEKLVSEGPAPDTVIALLKHPIAASEEGQRQGHLRHTRAFELYLRSAGRPEVVAAQIQDFGDDEASAQRDAWCAWLLAALAKAEAREWPAPIFDLAEIIARGPSGDGFGRLWERGEGEEARSFAQEMASLSENTDALEPADLRRLFHRHIMRAEVREEDPVHRNVQILGTLEARGQSADLVILGGLVEGVWPSDPSPDPWLNRSMRAALGLLSPERETGLAGHDFQQAASAGKVILSRSLRDSQAETVPSRWISRLVMLVEGLPDQNGPAAMQAMRKRGASLVGMARALDVAPEVSKSVRPAPCPPVSVRPRDLTVTEIQTLIRDPYAIYARHVLALKKLDPLHPSPDARLKGIVLHNIVEHAVREGVDRDPQAIIDIAEAQLRDLPFPSHRAAWLARVRAFAGPFAKTQADRSSMLRDRWTETKAKLQLEDGLSVRGKADRIDLLSDGTLAVIDYKSGTLPSRKQVIHFDRQLLIEAVMLEAGAFGDIAPAQVSEVIHVALKRAFEMRALSIAADAELSTGRTRAELLKLLRAFLAREQGYASRRAMEEMSYSGDYDHLARFGEWDIAEEPTRIPLP